VNHPKADVGPFSRFGKSYFLIAVGSYVLGLAVTMGVMHWTRHAQPALLYLSPACSEFKPESWLKVT
jgi:minor histocompatibility antigen H13